MSENETIVAAAIERNGLVYSIQRPARHHNVMRQMAAAGIPIPIEGTQGFLTNTGRFVDRREARLIADKARQIKARIGDDGVPYSATHKDLFSEDVW
jgi:hypothetical protein